jgi:hypothetical protein
VATARAIGEWTLLEQLGTGGNATVWKAARGDGEPIALKVVNSNKTGREPYKRFIQEIEFLQGLGGYAGVLPILDSRLPAQLSGGERPWLAMPIARPVQRALEGEPLTRVVEAVASFAETLTRLAAEHGVAHRDIKPGNLYELDGAWLVGDFGLIALPDAEELTRTGKPLGPTYFMAYEMLRDPRGADPMRADVYSLAKTLWVLACGQNYPPQGHQPAGSRHFTIAETRPEKNAALLDQLVDRMTRLDPSERPSMEEVFRELEGWMSLRAEPGGIDLSGLRAEVAAKLEHELAAEDLEQQYKDGGAAAARRLQTLMKPIEEALRSFHPRPEIGLMPDQLTRNLLETHRGLGQPEVIFKWGRLDRVASGPSYHRYSLRLGYGVEVTDDGEVAFPAFIQVGPEGVSGANFFWQRPEGAAAVGSIASDELLRAGVEELGRQLEQAARAFTEGLPGG